MEVTGKGFVMIARGASVKIRVRVRVQISGMGLSLVGPSTGGARDQRRRSRFGFDFALRSRFT